jgi:hypothetical protein
MNSAIRRKYEEARRQLAGGRYSTAIDLLREVVGHQPGDREPRLHLAKAYFHGRQFASALAELEELQRRFPTDVDVLSNQAALLSEIGRLEQAFQAVTDALQVNPVHAGALCNLGEILTRMGNWEAARDVYAAGLAAHPSDAKLHVQHALVLLTMGDWESGWAEYEHRFAHPEGEIRVEPVSSPRLRPGEPLAGRRVLIVHEQGLGDSLMFSRFVTVLAERGALVHLRCPEPLVTLLQQLPGLASCTVPGSPIPNHDVHVPLMSLPHVLQITPDAISGRAYLKAPGSCPAHLADALPPDDRLTVALCWAGNPSHVNDRRRSIPGALLAPLRELSDVRIVLMQKSPPATSLIPSEWLETWIDIGSRCHSFADSAHALERVDLVVTVDTAMAHLAGALGQRTLLLLPYIPDFRWGRETNTSPWYDSMRLMRQMAPLDWSGVLANVADQINACRKRSA